MKSGKYLMEDFKGFQFREIGQVDAIVSVQHLQDATTLGRRQLQEMSREIIQAEKQGKGSSLRPLDVVSMVRL